MDSPFRRSRAALGETSPRALVVPLAIAALMLAGWMAWLFGARLRVYAVSQTASVEVAGASLAIDSPIDGRLQRSLVTVGDQVEAGAVLFQLDTESDTLGLRRIEAEVEGITRQIAQLEGETQATGRASREDRAAGTTGLEEARARYEEAQIAARLAAEEWKRVKQLEGQGLVSQVAALGAKAEMEKTQSSAETLRLAVARQTREHQGRQETAGARRMEAGRELARLEGERAAARAALERLRHQVQMGIIRAPAGGRLGEVIALRSGAFVRQGERLATLVPPGILRVAAEFPAAAVLGRVRPGQRGRFRLEGFPWAQYGTVPVSVARVAQEPREGLFRVELDIEPDPSTVPLQHGLPGVAEVEVERVSPATLILRAAGARLGALRPSSGAVEHRPRP